MQWLALIILIVSFPVTGSADQASEFARGRAGNQHDIDLHVQDQDERALRQMKDAVCGTGPIYAGTVDNPILVKPLFKPACTITDRPSLPR